MHHPCIISVYKTPIEYYILVIDVLTLISQPSMYLWRNDSNWTPALPDLLSSASNLHVLYESSNSVTRVLKMVLFPAS